MRVAAYIRVSTDEQVEEGYSISAQRDRLAAFCVSQGWTIMDFYIDEGKSGKDLERPDLQRLLNDLEKDLFDIVLVYRLDRLTRSVVDLHKLLNLFESHNVKFKSATEVYDTTTAMGRLFITLVAALAQWERENLGERTRFGMEQMVREGKRPGGPIPYGYDKEEKIVDEERETLRLLRQIYMSGEGFRRTGIILNGMNKLRRGKNWSSYSVWYALDNPYYAGLIRFGGKKKNGKYPTRKKEKFVDFIIVEGDHEPIFTREEYEEHKARMDRRSFDGYTKVREYWFAGVLRCARCGSRMSGRYHTQKRKDGSTWKYIAYICANRQQGKGCNMPMFRQELVEKLVLDYVRKIKLDHDEVKTQSKEDKSSQTEINSLKNELSKIDERRKKWQYAFVNDLISAEDLRERKKEEDENERIINERLSQLSVSRHNYQIKMADLLELWPALEDKERNDLIQMIFADITLHTPIEKAQANKKGFLKATILNVEYN